MRNGHLVFALTIAILAFADTHQELRAKEAPSIRVTELSKDRLLIIFDISGMTAADGTVLLVCTTARFAVEHGFRYFRMEGVHQAAPKKGSFEMALFASPPAGAKVSGPDSSPPIEMSEAEAVDAQGWLNLCREFGVGKPTP